MLQGFRVPGTWLHYLPPHRHRIETAVRMIS